MLIVVLSRRHLRILFWVAKSSLNSTYWLRGHLGSVASKLGDTRTLCYIDDTRPAISAIDTSEAVENGQC